RPVLAWRRDGAALRRPRRAGPSAARLGERRSAEARGDELGRSRPELGGEAGDGRVLEERAQRHLETEGLGDPRGGLRGEQRVAAQSEEVVLGADALASQQFPEDRRQLL